MQSGAGHWAEEEDREKKGAAIGGATMPGGTHLPVPPSLFLID